jgi:SAM-dependent methyltransferase
MSNELISDKTTRLELESMMTVLPSSLDNMHSRFLQRFVEAYSTGPSRAFLRSYEADLLSQVTLQPPVLDLACGDGLVSALTFGRVLESGCDLMISQLCKARERKQYDTLALADVRSLPYSDSSFATVVSNSSLEHIPRIDRFVDEVFRVLRPGGLFVFTVPNPRFNEWFWGNWVWSRLGKPDHGRRSIEGFNTIREHHNVFDAEEWNKLLDRSGFSSTWHTEYFPFWATFVFSILESLWNQSIVLHSPGRSRLSNKRINLGGGLLRLLPRRLRLPIQTGFLSLFSRQHTAGQGSHLLIASRK